MILKICRIKAREKAEGQLQELYETALKEVGESGAAIFEVHQMMMEDEDYCSSVENMITQQQVNAEYAVAVTGNSFSSMFAEIDILARTMGIPAIIAVPIQKEIYECMEPIGHVTKETARLTGLSERTVVLAGTVDAVAAALEMGVYAEGRVSEMTGTSSVVMFGFDRLVTGEKLSYLKGRKKDNTLLYGAMNTAGGSLRWFRDALFGGETARQDAYDRINEEIEGLAKGPTGLIFLPYMAGERAPIWDPDARGTFIGLNLNTNRAEMMRSIMEGACYALRDNMNQAAAMGIHAQDIICCGGCSKSDIWLSIKASVINKEIKIPEVNLGAPGGLAYMNAAYMGEYNTPEEAADAMLKIKKNIEPVKEWVPVYEELYQVYLASYQALREQFKTLARIR